MLQNKWKGYSLLEITIVISLLSIVISSIIFMISFVTNSVSNIFINNEGYMNGKISIEFITSEIERYSYIDIYNYEDDDDNRIEKIVIFKDEHKIFNDANVIYFYKETGLKKSNSLYFGGYSNGIMYNNRFSSYIKSIHITNHDEILNISIVTLDNIKNNNAESYYFNSKINIKNKKINFY